MNLFRSKVFCSFEFSYLFSDYGVEGIELVIDYPHGDSNIANKLKSKGFAAAVHIDIGKVVNGATISRRIFEGTVVDLNLSAKPAQVKLTYVDGQQALSSECFPV